MNHFWIIFKSFTWDENDDVHDDDDDDVHDDVHDDGDHHHNRDERVSHNYYIYKNDDILLWKRQWWDNTDKDILLLGQKCDTIQWDEWVDSGGFIKQRGTRHIVNEELVTYLKKRVNEINLLIQLWLI